MAVGDRQRSRVAVLRVTLVVPVATTSRIAANVPVFSAVATLLACRPLFIPALARHVAGAVVLFNDAFVCTQAIFGIHRAAARIALMRLG